MKIFVKTGAIIYSRFSPKEIKSTYSLAEQEKAGRKYISDNNLDLLKVFSDKKGSGKNLKRDGLKEMLEWIAKNPLKAKILIVSDITKLARNQQDLRSVKEILRFNRIKIVSLVYLMKDYLSKPEK